MILRYSACGLAFLRSMPSGQPFEGCLGLLCDPRFRHSLRERFQDSPRLRCADAFQHRHRSQFAQRFPRRRFRQRLEQLLDATAHLQGRALLERFLQELCGSVAQLAQPRGGGFALGKVVAVEIGEQRQDRIVQGFFP